MDKVLQALEEQRKSIDNLSQTPISLSRSGNNTQRNREEEAAETPPSAALMKEETEFVFKCQGVGHIAREYVSNTGQRPTLKSTHPMYHHALQSHPHLMSLTKIHRREMVSLHSRDSDSRKGRAQDSHSMPERIIGKCPVAVVKIGGVSVPCLLDSGSRVSTIQKSSLISF